MVIASYEVAAVYLNCPHCEEGIESDAGSTMWACGDVQAAVKFQQGQMECQNCDKKSKIPAAVIKMFS